MCKNNSISEIAKIVWANIVYTNCQINENDTTITEIKDIWGMINNIENIIKIKQDALNFNVKQNIDLMKKRKRCHRYDESECGYKSHNNGNCNRCPDYKF